jgi:hypothetical protein
LEGTALKSSRNQKTPHSLLKVYGWLLLAARIWPIRGEKGLTLILVSYPQLNHVGLQKPHADQP